MKINKSGATFSSIVSIGEKVKQMSETSGVEYLFLNRGVNAVCNINLTEVIKEIDFNSNKIQVYPPNRGLVELRDAINQEYFKGKSKLNNISIVPGGMAALDLTIQLLQIDTLFFSNFFWGSYSKMAKIRGVKTSTYDEIDNLIERLSSKIKDTEKIAVIICDPNNPIGNKINDTELLANIAKLNSLGVSVIFDSPYRKIFSDHDEDFFSKLLPFENVIITESFSKNFGLSGQRIAFIHSTNPDFNEELNTRMTYSFNGVNGFAQELVLKLLTSDAGKKAALNFRRETVKGINQNLKFLLENKLLATEFYRNTQPIGIFAVINMSQEELLKHRIGSVSMNYFCLEKSDEIGNYSRICVSVSPELFRRYFNRALRASSVELTTIPVGL